MSHVQDNSGSPLGASLAAGQPARYPAAASGTVWLFAAVVLLAGGLAFFNSIWGVFLYDDNASIRDNPHIRKLWPPSEAISLPLWNTGASVDARPVLSISLALNHALFGPEPRGYHYVNIAIHLCAALVLMGVVRRTLGSRRFAGTCSPGRAAFFAFAVSLLWVVHPLHAGSVTYIVQRAESLMGLFYLLTLYCCIRGFGSRRPWPWLTAGVVACWVGAGAKEVAATAPAVILLWDVLFNADSLRQALRRRWAFYGMLAASWVLSAGLVIVTWQNKAGDFEDDRVLVYAQTQPGVILHYLRLAFWPRPLATAYGWPSAETWRQILPGAVPIAALLALTVGLLWRRHWAGFLGAWFFVILAPSSSFIPTGQMAFDHRMYLPLAAVIVLTLSCGWHLLRRISFARLRGPVAVLLILAGSIALARETHLRNRDFHDALGFWADNVRNRPNSWMAHFGLGNELWDRGRLAEAVEEFKIALRISPRRARVYSNLGAALLALGRWQEAIAHLRKGIEVAPEFLPLRANLAVALLYENRLEESAQVSMESLEDNPDYALAYANLGLARLAQRRLPDAKACFQRAIELAPNDVATRCNLARVLVRMGDHESAIEHCRKALAVSPQFANAHYILARALTGQGRFREAIGHIEQAVRLEPGNRNARNFLAILLATSPDDTLRDGQRALRLAHQICAATRYSEPDYLETLAAAFAEQGRFADAVGTARKAAKLMRARHGRSEDADRIEGQIAGYSSGQRLRLVIAEPPDQ